MNKSDLLASGRALMLSFCEHNHLTPPELRVQDKEAFRFADKTCAYYRPTRISICPPACAAPGYGGMAWSWPGYVIDRTPHGVVQHELGHHIDHMTGGRKGSYWSDFSTGVRRVAGEDKLTNYCPNDAEWFAEMFRLFVTNPDLLSKVRPRTYDRLARSWSPVILESWDAVLRGAPQRTIDQAEKKMRESRRQGVLL